MIISFKLARNLKNATDNYYESNPVEWKLSDATYELRFRIVTADTANKMQTSISQLLIKNSQGRFEEFNDKQSLLDLTCALASTIQLIESQFLKLKEVSQSKAQLAAQKRQTTAKSNNGSLDASAKNWVSYLPSEFDMDTDKDKPFSSPIELSDNTISQLLKAKENRQKLFSSSLISRMEDFIPEWELGIEKDSLEQYFEDLLLKYKDLIPVLFGYDGVIEVFNQEKLAEVKENRTDISIVGKDGYWIIELKRPSTGLFTPANSRSNLSGINSAFSSAFVQVALYVMKKNRELPLNSAFSKGTLLIGKDEMLNTPEKKLAYRLFTADLKVNVITFDGIIKHARAIVAEFKK